MANCNDCKTELEKLDDDLAICPKCKRIWNLTADNSAIQSDGTVQIKGIVQSLDIFRLVSKE